MLRKFPLSIVLAGSIPCRDIPSAVLDLAMSIVHQIMPMRGQRDVVDRIAGRMASYWPPRTREQSCLRTAGLSIPQGVSSERSIARMAHMVGIDHLHRIVDLLRGDVIASIQGVGPVHEARRAAAALTVPSGLSQSNAMFAGQAHPRHSSHGKETGWPNSVLCRRPETAVAGSCNPRPKAQEAYNWEQDPTAVAPTAAVSPALCA